MNDWKIIWNNFCDEVASSVRNNNTEMVFEKDIAREFFRALDWYRLNKGLTEQYPIKFGTSTHRADFALFISEKVSPEIIVELKRPQKRKEEKDAKQLMDYMRQTSCSFGILLLGAKLEVYHIDYSTPQHEAALVETIKYEPDNEAARQLMEVLYRADYSSSKMLDYCRKQVKINKSVEYWCSAEGKAEILNMIIERSQLPQHQQETLRQTLHIAVGRNDGLNPLASYFEEKTIETTPPILSEKVEAHSGLSRVWMIPANPRYFDHKACFDELGAIYWKQSNNFQVGDIGYIYFSKPLKRIVFKFEVVACDLRYNKEMDVERKYYKNLQDFENAKQHNRFVKLKKIGECSNERLSIEKLMKHGLKWAPQGALQLSGENYEALLNYIESYF